MYWIRKAIRNSLKCAPVNMGRILLKLQERVRLAAMAGQVPRSLIIERSGHRKKLDGVDDGNEVDVDGNGVGLWWAEIELWWGEERSVFHSYFD
jgi:hypothetical protein